MWLNTWVELYKDEKLGRKASQMLQTGHEIKHHITSLTIGLEFKDFLSDFRAPHQKKKNLAFCFQKNYLRIKQAQ